MTGNFEHKATGTCPRRWKTQIQIWAAMVLTAVIAAPPGAAQTSGGGQGFVLAPNKSTAFEFAVERPGVIAIEANWKGPPLVFMLRGPGARSIQKTGSGNIQITYNVNAAEAQSGQVWRLYIRADSLSRDKNPARLPEPEAGGTVSIQESCVPTQLRLRPLEPGHERQGAR